MSSRKGKRSRVGRKKSREKLNPTEAINKLIDAPLEAKHFKKLFSEIHRTRNSRGAGVLLGTYVEQALEAAIERNLHTAPTKRRVLFGPSAPMGSFLNKIRVAKAMGIIGSETFDNLDKIRLVRNAFAHAKMAISFQTKEIEGVCRTLTIPKPLSPFHISGLREGKVRTLFTEVCFVTAHNLMFAAIGAPKVLENKFVSFPIADDFEIVLRRKSLP